MEHRCGRYCDMLVNDRQAQAKGRDMKWNRKFDVAALAFGMLLWPACDDKSNEAEAPATATAAQAAVVAPNGQKCAIHADPATFACSSDDECMVYQLSACTPNNGGTAVGINTRYKNSFSKKYNAQSCPPKEGCAEGADRMPKVSCVSGVCPIEEY